MTALDIFKECYKNVPDQGEVGHSPATYIMAAATILSPNDAGYEAVREAAIALVEGRNPYGLALNKKLDRGTLLRLCQDEAVDPMAAFCCCMAWGSQWSVKGGFDNFSGALGNASKLTEALSRLKHGEFITRKAAFEYLSDKKAGGISGLGPSFYTKLIFFFEARKPNRSLGYIWDSRVKASYEKLKSCFPEFKMSYQHGDGQAGRYEDYCRFVDCLTLKMGWADGSATEVALFGNSADWRSYLNR